VGVLRRLVARLAQGVPVLVGVTLLVVASAHLVPGSPGEAFLGEKGTRAKIEELDEAIGWHDPLWKQWGRAVWSAARGDLGRSFRTGEPVASELRSRLGATAELALAAMLFAAPLGIGVGVLSALVRRFPWTLIDHAAMAVALVGISVPVFWLGLLLQIHLFPSQQRLALHLDLTVRTGFYTIDALLMGDPAVIGDVFRRLALPALALGTSPLAVITRMTRSAMLDVLGCDYIRTARAKGLGEARIAVRHALRNALVPVVTVVGLQLAALLGGAVLTESVFQWPGLGTYIVEAAKSKDLPALQGAVLCVAAAFVALNLAVDLLYGVLDPRISSSGAGA